MTEEDFKCCDTCEHCMYIGEGDYICDEHYVLVKEEHCPNDDYNYCNEVDWEELD